MATKPTAAFVNPFEGKKIPKDYKSRDVVKALPPAHRRKLTELFRDQEQAEADAKAEAKYLEKERTFNDNRSQYNYGLFAEVMRAQGLMTLIRSLYNSTPGYSMPYDETQLFDDLRKGLKVQAVNEEAGKALVVSCHIEHNSYWNSSWGRTPREYNTEEGSSANYEAVTSEVGDLIVFLKDKLSTLNAELEKRAKEQRAREERNALRDKLRSKLSPDEAALLSHNE